MLEIDRTRIKVVSLASASERRGIFTQRAEGAPVAWDFFDAYTELSPDLRYDDETALSNKGRVLRKGELGCYASHFALWQKLLTDQVDQYIILEDDVIVDWKAIATLCKVDFARSGVEYLRLYQKRPADFILRKAKYISRERTLVEFTSMAFGTQGYVITKSAARRFVDTFKIIKRPIDDQMDRFWEHGIPNLCLLPFPLIEEAVPSIIGFERFEDQAALKMTVRHRFMRRLDKLRRLLAVSKRKRFSSDWKVEWY